MQIHVPAVGNLPTDKAALAIIKACGDRASALVAEQIEQHHKQPDLVQQWRAIGTAVTALTQANLHMEVALDLLDTTKASSAGVHLDAAITSLGVRQDTTVRVLIGKASREQAECYYSERVEQHLALAARADDPAVKGVHLDIASRYATLGQLAAEQAHGSDQVDRSNPVRA